MDRLTFAADYAMEGDTLSGVVHVFGTRTLRDGLLHEFAPTAFGKAQPLAFYSHDTTKPLAHPSIAIEDGKLHFSMTLGHQSYAEDLRENQRLGLMRSMSFGVTPLKWKDTRTPEGIVRTHTKSALFDISPVAMPAFEGTTAQLHSSETGESVRSQAIRARHRVLTRTAL